MNIMKPFVRLASRRSMLRGALLGPGLMGAALLAGIPSKSLAAGFRDDDELSEGDVSILRFLAALEILEADLWEQYNELGGIRDSELTSGTGAKLIQMRSTASTTTCRNIFTTTPMTSSATRLSSTSFCNRKTLPRSAWKNSGTWTAATRPVRPAKSA
jgi:hypothetical protein